MSHDMRPLGSYGSRMGHDVEPFESISMGHMTPGPNMDTQGMEASSTRYPPPQWEVKEKGQPEVVEEKKPVKSKSVIRISIPGTVWCVVQTNNGKHFFYNATKRQSVWKMPEELKNRPDVEKLLSSKPEVKTEKEEQQSVQEEPPSKKFKSETEVREENTNEGAQNIALGQETAIAKEVQATELRSTLSLEVRMQQFRELLAENNEKEQPEVVDEKKPDAIEEKKPEDVVDKKLEVNEEKKSESKPEEKPVKSKPLIRISIPGTVWCVVQTNNGKHFFYNATKRQSVWKMPEELKNRPDVEKLLSSKPEVKTEKEEQQNVQEEPPSKKFKLDTEGNEEKEESSSEATQKIMLEKETTNAVEVQAAENMPVVSLEDRKRQFKELLAENDTEETIDVKVLRSKKLAIRGNEMAQMGENTAAIQLFTEAINLDQTDFRFFGNRSYCYDRIEQYDKALRDAEQSIKLNKKWPKGYFRQGRALAGLKMYVEAETAFIQVLKLDKNCDKAHAELLRVKTHQLMDLGFSQSQSKSAVKKFGTVQAALDSLLAGVDTSLNDLYRSDDRDNGFHVHQPPRTPPPVLDPADTKMDPTNPEGLTALWVGNVLPTVTENKLNLLFSKYGQVTSIRVLPKKHCAFVNFKTKEAAGRAMHQLQGMEVDGEKLRIKFPDNPRSNSPSNFYNLQKDKANGRAKQRVRKKIKQSGPVNGDECSFWRNTGCRMGSKCNWQHYPKSKGIDKKTWQK